MLSTLIRKYSKDMIPGGLGDKDPDSAFDKKELAKGIKHEMEHTENPALAKELTKDHIKPIHPTESENTNPKDDRIPNYYEMLDKMESLSAGKSTKMSTSDVVRILS